MKYTKYIAGGIPALFALSFIITPGKVGNYGGR
jgi:hypothetical protein